MDPIKKKKKQLDNYARYTGIGFQMLVIILIGVFGGVKLDQWLDLNVPVFTIFLSILSVILAIYYAVKDFLKMDKKNRANKNTDQ